MNEDNNDIVSEDEEESDGLAFFDGCLYAFTIYIVALIVVLIIRFDLARLILNLLLR